MRDGQEGIQKKNRKQQTNHIEKHVKQQEQNGTKKGSERTHINNPTKYQKQIESAYENNQTEGNTQSPITTTF